MFSGFRGEMTPIVLAFVDVPQNRPPESSENCFLKLRSSFDGEYFDVFIFFFSSLPNNLPYGGNHY